MANSLEHRFDLIQRDYIDTRLITRAYKPSPAQAEILNCPKQYICAALPRKFGKTALAVRWLIDNYTKPGDLTCYVSTTYDTQAEVTVPEILAQCPEAIYVESKNKIIWTTGAITILKYADDPRAARRQRGRSRFVAWVFDEIGFYADDYIAVKWADLGPTNARALCVSTKWAGGEWQRICTEVAPENPNDYALYEDFTFFDGRPPGQTEEERQLMYDRYKAMMPRLIFEREIGNHWGAKEGAVFPWADEAWERGAAMDGLPAKDNRYGVGLDFGQLQDYTALVLCGTDYALYPLLNIRLEGWEMQMERVKAMLGEYPYAMPPYCDATGIGSPVLEMAGRVGLKFFPINFGAKTPDKMLSWKEQLVLDMSLHGEGGQVSIPHTEIGKMLHRQMLNYVYKTTSGGHYRYEADGDGHDDLVCGAMLSVQGAQRIPAVIMQEQKGAVKSKPVGVDKPSHRAKPKRIMGGFR